MALYWEVYSIDNDDNSHIMSGFKNKREAIRYAVGLSGYVHIPYIEVRAHNGEELIDDTFITIKRNNEYIFDIRET